MHQKYLSIEPTLRSEIENLIRQRKYLSIQYFTEIRELITTRVIIKRLVQKEGAEFIELSTGEEIRLDLIVRLGDKPAPGYHIDDFTCDC